MSYSIAIHGHKDTADAAETLTFEQEVADKARELVAALDGVTSATLTSGTQGVVNLTVPA